MSLNQLGTRLGKPVLLLKLERPDDFAADEIGESVVLFWIVNRFWSTGKFTEVIKKCAANRALNITVAGEETEKYFSILLENLSAIHTPQHIMTGVWDDTTMKNVLENFFIASWPAEERFDEWKSYMILFCGDSELEKQIKAAVASLKD